MRDIILHTMHYTRNTLFLQLHLCNRHMHDLHELDAFVGVFLIWIQPGYRFHSVGLNAKLS